MLRLSSPVASSNRISTQGFHISCSSQSSTHARAKTNKNKQTQPQVLHQPRRPTSPRPCTSALSCRQREFPIYSGSVCYIAWIACASYPLEYEPMHTKNRFEFPVSAIQGSMEGTTTKRGRKTGVVIHSIVPKREARRERRGPRFIVIHDRSSPRRAGSVQILAAWLHAAACLTRFRPSGRSGHSAI
jgi:hypothetical protein